MPMEIWRGAGDAQWEHVQQDLEARGLTDGLPVVAPTAERVSRMLAAGDFDGRQTVAVLPPSFAETTWRDIAINAVMAGCTPGCLGIVGAAVEAIAAPEFNLVGIATTTGSAAPLIIVNGPVAAQVGINSGANALGPGVRANATIGRALSLVLRNVGGAIPGQVDMATLGQPSKYTCCIAENEAASPWPALHVERGFGREQSVVTVVGIAGTVEVVDSASSTLDDLAQTFAQSMLLAGTLGGAAMLGGGEPLILMPPEIANTLSAAGRGKEDVKAAIHERAVMPADRLSPAVLAHLASRMGATEGWTGGALRVAARPQDLMIVVVGGVGVKAAFAPTWGGGTRAVSRVVRGAP